MNSSFKFNTRKLIMLLLTLSVSAAFLTSCTNMNADANTSQSAPVTYEVTNSVPWCGVDQSFINEYGPHEYKSIQALRDAVESQSNKLVHNLEYILTYPNETDYSPLTKITISEQGFILNYAAPLLTVKYTDNNSPEDYMADIEKQNGVIKYETNASLYFQTYLKESSETSDGTPIYRYYFVIGKHCITIQCPISYADEAGDVQILNLQFIYLIEIQ